MNKKALEAVSKQAAKSIKTESDLTDFRKMLTKVTVEVAFYALIHGHPGYSRHQQSHKDNYRNGYSPNTIRTEDGEVALDTPRDTDSCIAPLLVKHNQTCFASMDDKIPSLYSKGMTTREIVSTINQMLDADVYPTLISQITNAVIEHVVKWQRGR